MGKLTEKAIAKMINVPVSKGTETVVNGRHRPSKVMRPPANGRQRSGFPSAE